MKKLLILSLLLGATLLSACNKVESTKTPSLVHIGYTMRSNSMYDTKAFQSSDVLSLIQATLPTSVRLVLTSQTTNKTFVTQSGEGIILPTDTYRVLGNMGGEISSSLIGSMTDAYLAKTPCIDINDNLVINDEETDYVVGATYKCFGLAMDAEEVEKAYVTTSKGEEEIKFISDGELMFTFAQGEYTNTNLVIRVVPVDKERYVDTTYKLNFQDKTGCQQVQFGKFYKLVPTATGKQPRVVAVDLPDFADGGTLISL